MKIPRYQGNEEGRWDDRAKRRRPNDPQHSEKYCSGENQTKGG
jgi:hypothetical protein